MRNIIDEYKKLYDSILNDNISLNQLEKEFKKIELSYGTDAFNPCDFKRSEKPWNKAYLENLKKLYRAGASSKDFFIHLYEVNKYLRHKKIKYYLAFSISLLFIILCIFGIINLSHKRNKSHIQRIALESTSSDSCAIYNQVLSLPKDWTVVKSLYILNDDKLADGLHLYIQPSLVKCPGERCKEKTTVTENNLEWKYLKFFEHESFVHVFIPTINCSIHGEYKYEFPLGVEGEEYLESCINIIEKKVLEEVQVNSVELEANETAGLGDE